MSKKTARTPEKMTHQTRKGGTVTIAKPTQPTAAASETANETDKA